MTICSRLGLKSGFSNLNMLCTVDTMLALTNSSAQTAPEEKNGERDWSAQSISWLIPTYVDKVDNAAVLHSVSTRRWLA